MTNAVKSLVATNFSNHAIDAYAKATGKGRTGWKIFETSGTTAGQQTAFGLLDFGADVYLLGGGFQQHNTGYVLRLLLV